MAFNEEQNGAMEAEVHVGVASWVSARLLFAPQEVRMTKRLLLLAAVAFLVPQFALAGSVTYSTTGAFSSTGTGSSGNMSVTFTGVGSTTITTPDPTAPLGTFAIGTMTCLKIVCTYTDNLTITITQTAPSGGTGSLTAMVNGTLFVTFTPKTATITWAFDAPGYTDIGGVVYVGNNGTSTGASGAVTATVGGPLFVTEPNARLLLGLGTLGVMGLALVSRKMING